MSKTKPEHQIIRLRNKYSECILQALTDCRSPSHDQLSPEEDVDLIRFQSKLFRLMKAAEADGIPMGEFRALVSGRLPRLYPKLVLSVTDLSPKTHAHPRRTAA